MGAQVLTRIVSFFYTIFLANKLGVEGFGLITVAIAYFAILSALTDFGFNRFLIREIARGELKIADMLGNILMLRVLLPSIVIILFSIVLYSLDPDKMRVSLILIAVLAVFPESIAVTLDGIFIGLQKLQYSAISLVIASSSAAILGFYLVNGGSGPVGAVIAIIFAQIMWALCLLIFLLRKKLLSFSKLNFSLMKKILVGSLPYGLIGVLGLLYFRIDSVILSYLRGSFETGIYGAGYRFLESIIFIPGAFGFALFPSLAKLHDTNISDMKKLYFRSLKLMGLLGLIIFLGYLFILPEIIRILLPNYSQSVDVIRILSFSIPFIFVATPGVQVLLSSDKYLKSVIFLSLFTVV
ncbi:hypothetical protein A3A45_03485, partial [Candidatus Daviesbacteria bacterium RIFCSPLOWO2_01_FULL_36_8]